MKRKNFNLAIIMMVVAAFISVAVVSCKKEDNSSLAGQVTSKPAFTPPQVDDMNAYLKGFKEKMKSSAKGEDEMLSLDEAAWHLSSLANYDFANANVEFTDLRYDTLVYQMNITKGQVALSDLNTLYASIANDIDAFYQSLDLQEKHFRFIMASVSEDGEVSICLTTSYLLLDHTWYYDNDWDASLACFEYFDEHMYYVWNTTAIDTLKFWINFLESRNFDTIGNHSERFYFVYSGNKEFHYQDNIDPYGSNFLRNSRIYAVEGDTWWTPYLDLPLMCYCLDSYLELPFEYIDNHNLGNQRPVLWDIDWEWFLPENSKWHIFCHVVQVTFGQTIAAAYDPIMY